MVHHQLKIWLMMMVSEGRRWFILIENWLWYIFCFCPRLLGRYWPASTSCQPHYQSIINLLSTVVNMHEQLLTTTIFDYCSECSLFVWEYATTSWKLYMATKILYSTRRWFACLWSCCNWPCCNGSSWPCNIIAAGPVWSTSLTSIRLRISQLIFQCFSHHEPATVDRYQLWTTKQLYSHQCSSNSLIMHGHKFTHHWPIISHHWPT